MAEKKLYIGVDLGGTKILSAVVDARGQVLHRVKKKTRAQQSPESVVDRVCECVVDVMKAASITARHVQALGIGAPGPVDFDRGVVLTAGNMPWKNVPLRAMLEKKLGIKPVVVDNDVNVGTFGEWKAGAGRGSDNLLGVFVGTGIGGGFVLDGRLYRGHFHTAGEIGHTIVQAGGPATGRSLEDLASRAAMGVQIARRITTNHPSSLTGQLNLEELFTNLRSKMLADAFKAGDRVVVEAVQESARYVGIAIANAVTLLSLQRVVVGGGLVEALGRPYVKLVQTQARADLFPATLPVEIVEAQLKDDAGVVGAALLARSVASAS